MKAARFRFPLKELRYLLDLPEGTIIRDAMVQNSDLVLIIEHDELPEHDSTALAPAVRPRYHSEGRCFDHWEKE